MFRSRASLSIDTSPLEIVRRYAPVFIITIAGIVILSAMYFRTFNEGEALINTSANTTSESYSSNADIVKEAMAQANQDLLNK